MVRQLKGWPLSGYRDNAGLCQEPVWFTTEWLVSVSGKREPSRQKIPGICNP